MAGEKVLATLVEEDGTPTKANRFIDVHYAYIKCTQGNDLVSKRDRGGIVRGVCKLKERSATCDVTPDGCSCGGPFVELGKR